MDETHPPTPQIDWDLDTDGTDESAAADGEVKRTPKNTEPVDPAQKARIEKIKQLGGNPDVRQVSLLGFNELTNEYITEGIDGSPANPIDRNDPRHDRRIGYYGSNNGTLVYVDAEGKIWFGPDTTSNRATLINAGYLEDDSTHGVPTPRTQFVRRH